MLYTVGYRAASNSDEANRNSVDDLNHFNSEEVELDEVIANCKELEAEADLYDVASFRKGWVHADGSYTLV